MGLTQGTLNLMLDNIGSQITYASLHTDAVGSGSGNEVTGGSPVYARKAITWDAADAGAMVLHHSVTFNVPASTTIRRIGLWDSPSGGTFLGDASITQKTFSSQGTYTLTAATIALT